MRSITEGANDIYTMYSPPSLSLNCSKLSSSTVKLPYISTIKKTVILKFIITKFTHSVITCATPNWALNEGLSSSC